MQDPDIGREVVKEIRAAVKLEVFHRSSNISQDRPDRTSHGEGLSMFDLPSYVFKGGDWSSAVGYPLKSQSICSEHEENL